MTQHVTWADFSHWGSCGCEKKELTPQYFHLISTCVLWYAYPYIMHTQTTIINFWKRHPVSISGLHNICICSSVYKHTQSHTHTQPIHTTQTHIFPYIHYVTKEQVIKLIHRKIIRKYTFQLRSMNGHITYDIPYYNNSTYLSVKVIQLKSILWFHCTLGRRVII